MNISEKETTARPGAGEKKIIKKGDTISDVKKAFKEGYSIHFSAKDDFVDFTDEDLAQLPKALTVYYVTALRENLGTLGEMVDTMSGAGTLAREFGYDKRVADPEDQLKLEDIAPGFTAKWVRAYDDEVRKHERKGYIIAEGSILKSFTNRTNKGIHIVGSKDKPEMIAMVISDENFALNEKRIKAKSDLRKEAIKTKFVKSITDSGLKGAQADVEEDDYIE